MRFKTNTKLLIILFILLFSFIVGTLSQLARIVDHKENDHWVYYRTSKRIENKEVNEIYSFKDGALPFRYSPPSLMMFSWMSSFTEKNSRQIWLIIQSLFIFGSFPFIYKVLLKIGSPSPIYSIAFSFFLFYRYFLDSLYCGQVSGIVFFLFSSGLYFWINKQRALSNLSILFLSLLKIVPGFMFIINFADTKTIKDFVKLLTYLILSMSLILGIYFIWFLLKFGFQNLQYFVPMFKTWIFIALSDQQYFDGSTIKSQALRAFLLRFLGNDNKTEIIWRICSLVSICSLFLFWFKVKMHSPKIRIYCFSLGILAYVIFMPESLPYQVFKLLIPLIFLMNEFLISYKKSFKLFFVLVLVFCCLSTPDLTGHSWANNIQALSLPFFIFVIMGGLILNEIYSLHKLNSKI